MPNRNDLDPLQPRPARRRRTSPPPALTDVPGQPAPGLKDEIAMVRTVIRRVMALADNGHSLGELLKLLDTLSKASGRLATLLKAERALCEDVDVASALKRALANVLEELESETQEQNRP